MLLKKELNDIEGFFPVIYDDLKKEIICLLELEKMMVNVAYLNSNQKKRDVHDVMGFKGQIFLDSGVFQRGFFKKQFTEEEIKDYRDKLLRWYSCLKPDYASSLDLPAPFPSTSKEKKRRVLWTIENYKVMKNRINIPLVLGLSLFSKLDIHYAEEEIKRRLRKTPNLLGLGGLVPLMRLSEKEPNYGKLIIKIISHFRKKFPHVAIHVYGLGNRKWYPLIRLVGVTSSDYAGFNKISGEGGILSPTSLSAKYILKLVKLQTKKGLTYYRRQEKDTFSDKDMKTLYKCECPICKRSDPHLLEFDRTKRIIHNLFVILKQNKLIDGYCTENNFVGLKNYIRKGLHCKDLEMKKIVNYTFKINE